MSKIVHNNIISSKTIIKIYKFSVLRKTQQIQMNPYFLVYIHIMFLPVLGKNLHVTFPDQVYKTCQASDLELDIPCCFTL